MRFRSLVYMVPKNTPLRPINYQHYRFAGLSLFISKYLASILKPLSGPTNHDHLVSFDVESHFTNVPIPDKLIFLSPSFQVAIFPWISSSCPKLKNVLTPIYFYFRGNFCCQQSGTAMGSL